MAKKEGKQQVKDLVRKFERMPDYRLKTCNEEQTKKNFILPLFETLGWDVRSDEVRAEEKVSGGRVDYAFKISGITKFYLEAKPVRADLDKSEEQLIDYAYNKDVTWGVLTNFKELRIFNALEKTPSPIKFTLETYLKDFDLLWLISKESFETGEINKWAERFGIKSVPVPPVGEQLAKDLTEWRDELTKRIRSWETKLTQEEVDEAVQKFLDRLIFIRVAEDRGLEERVLLPLYNKHKGEAGLITELNKLFREFWKKYDSTLFRKHFSENLELEGVVDNVGNIIKGMHETTRDKKLGDGKRYDFSLIDADILGAVYEQYLGTIQRKGKGAKRKEQGIYYTPKFIVNYIVENTLGKLLYEENLPVREVKELKILDPACGSGSFLIKAFEVLDEFYGKAKAPESDRRKHILTKNLYGVDLDPKAVEVTQLNLMLSAAKKRELLPELHENLKVGNSLISGTEKELKNYFGESWRDRKPFDWKEEFSKVFKQGGFDVIIGNPPYGAEITKEEVDLFKQKYSAGSTDTAILFIKMAFDLLGQKGKMGFIVPKALCFASNWQKIREYIWDNVETIIDCGKAWKEVKLEQVVFVINKGKKTTSYASGRFENGYLKILGNIDKKDAKDFGFFLNGISETELAIAKKIKTDSIMLNDISTNQRGAILQKFVSDTGDKQVIGGAQVQKFGIVGIKGKIDSKKIKDEQAFVKNNSILVQRIVAHIENPIDHIKITACVPQSKNYVIVDTINQITLNNEIDPFAIWCFLNSKLINWYAYRFIFGKAIRTMQFDNPTTARLPIPKNIKDNQTIFIELAKRIICLGRDLQAAAEGGNKWRRVKSEIERTDKQIDKAVYKLYNLTPEEIKIVEES